MKGDATPGQVFSNIALLVNTVASKVRNENKYNTVGVVVNLEVQEDKLEEFKVLVKNHTKCSRLEEGCYRFDILTDPDNKLWFTLYEGYKDMAAFEFHLSTPYFIKIKAFIDTKAFFKFTELKVMNAEDFTF
jgi:autoinducer 2-degrading protein